MGQAVDSSLLDTITRTIVERFSPKRVIVFGSWARGEGKPESDVDVFVEMETDKPPPERAIEVSSAFGLRPWGLDVAVYTPAEVRRFRGVKGTLLEMIEAEGKVMYERA